MMMIGDANGMVLNDGTFMIQSIASTKQALVDCALW
jgi:hypothetical protein